jgi:uncharacterized phage protein gp47/JayE
MQLPLQNFSALMQTMAAGVQGAASQLLDMTVGSVLRAILEATASIALWLQWLIVQVLGVTRAATSTGPDLDSWVADFSLTRLPAMAATGLVTFARYTPGLTAFIPVGAQVISSDGTQTFTVTADSTNSAFVAASDGYSVAAGVGSVTVPVVATLPGSAGNLQPGTATLLGTAIAGIDTVTNPLPFAGGADAESDAALRIRFANYIQSRTLATPLAVATAIAGVQQNLTYALQENVDGGGNPLQGSFLVTIDDGSGNPPASLLSAATSAIDAVRPIGSAVAVRAPSIYFATITMTLGIVASANPASVTAAVVQALETTINALPIGAPLPWSRLAQIAYDASSSVSNVTAVSLNGTTADLGVPPNGVVKTGAVTVA